MRTSTVSTSIFVGHAETPASRRRGPRLLVYFGGPLV